MHIPSGYGYISRNLSFHQKRVFSDVNSFDAKLMKIGLCLDNQSVQESQIFKLIIQKPLKERRIRFWHPDFLSGLSYDLDEDGREIYHLYEYTTISVCFKQSIDYSEHAPEQTRGDFASTQRKATWIQDNYVYRSDSDFDEQYRQSYRDYENVLRCCVSLDSEVSFDDVFESHKQVTGFEPNDQRLFEQLLGKRITGILFENHPKQFALVFREIWETTYSALIFEAESNLGGVHLKFYWQHENEKPDRYWENENAETLP